MLFFLVPGRSRNVVMAGTSRRPSSELGPDLSSPTPPKKSKFSEASIEGRAEKEHDLSTEELESVEKLSGAVASSSLPENTIEVIPGSASETNPFEIGGESLESAKQSSLEGPANVAGSSKEGHFASFETIAQMKYSGQKELSGSSNKRSDSDSDVQIQTSIIGEDASYQELSLIGNGAYGTVYKAKDLNTGQVVALKKVRVPLTADGLPTSTLREIATLKQLERFEHPHIVSLAIARLLLAVSICIHTLAFFVTRAGKIIGRLSRELSTLAFSRWKVGEIGSRIDVVACVRARGKGSGILHVLLFADRNPSSRGETNVEGNTQRCGIFAQS